MKKKLKLVEDWINKGPTIPVRTLAIMLLLSMALAALLTACEMHARHL